MARPSRRNTIKSRLPVSRVPFQWDLESMQSRGARDASAEQLLALINWADREAFLKEVVGYTTWDKTSTLQRVLPLRHPLRPTMWCDEYLLHDFGMYDTRSDLHDPENEYDPAAPVQDWCRYLLTFTRPKWFVYSDADLRDEAKFGLNVGKEQFRFTFPSEMPQPRNRKVSGHAFEFLSADGTWKAIENESQFVPDYQIDETITWVQIPTNAVPYQSILDCLNTVNNKPIQLTTGGRTWVPGTLAFKGCARPVEQYIGADGTPAYDLYYLFSYQPGGWQNYMTRDAVGAKVYKPIRIRVGAGAGFPPFYETDFQNLFTPG